MREKRALALYYFIWVFYLENRGSRFVELFPHIIKPGMESYRKRSVANLMVK